MPNRAVERGRTATLQDVHVLLATDVDWLVDDVVAAIGDSDTRFTVVNEGREVSKHVAAAAKAGTHYDIAIADLQIGSMGGVAVTMALRLDASADLVPEIPVLLLLDRVADVHLAKRSVADGWLVKPLDPLRLRRAVRTIAAGGRYTEGLVEHAETAVPTTGGALNIDPHHGVEVELVEPDPDAVSTGSEPTPAG